MIRAVLNWFLGKPLETLAGAYAKHKDSETEKDRVLADVAKNQMDNEVRTQGIAKDVRVVTAGFWEMRALTFLIAAPFVLHLNLVALDTCFKLGWAIPAFPPPFDENGWKILLSFFGIAVANKGIHAIAAALIARRR